MCMHCLPELHHMGGPSLLSCRGKTVQESRAHNAQIAAEEQAYRNEQRSVLFSSCCHHGSCTRMWSQYKFKSFPCTGPGAQQSPADTHKTAHQKTLQPSENSFACVLYIVSAAAWSCMYYLGTQASIVPLLAEHVLSNSSASARVTVSNSHLIHSVAWQECKISKPRVKGG